MLCESDSGSDGGSDSGSDSLDETAGEPADRPDWLSRLIPVHRGTVAVTDDTNNIPPVVSVVA